MAVFPGFMNDGIITKLETLNGSYRPARLTIKNIIIPPKAITIKLTSHHQLNPFETGSDFNCDVATEVRPDGAGVISGGAVTIAIC